MALGNCQKVIGGINLRSEDIARDAVLTVLMIVSAVLLTSEWLSIYNNFNLTVVFFAFLFTLSLGALIISLVIRMQNLMEELESAKRIISMSSVEMEERIDARLREYLRDLEERIESIERRIYK